jgi:hypothetical protein
MPVVASSIENLRRNPMNTRATLIRCALGALLFGSVANALAEVDEHKPWTAVASTGTVDEADAGIVSLSSGTATVTAVGTLDIRYNVVAVDGVFSPGDGIQMAVRFLDNGVSARVKLTLYQYNIASGVGTPILTFDSDGFPAAGGYQDQTIALCGPPWLDFVNNAYYVQASVSKTAAGGSAGLAIIQSGGTLC